MVHPGHVLLDDRALVQVAGDEVGGGTDLLHAAGVGLPVGVGALESRQERVVDVDAAPGERIAQLGGEDLHVARQHHQLHVVLVDGLQHPGFEGGLLLGTLDGQVLERHLVEPGQRGQRVVVGEDQRHLEREVPGVRLEQQIVDAVLRGGGQDQGAQRPACDVEGVLDVVTIDDRLQLLLELLLGGRGVHLDPHVEAVGGGAGELLGLGDVAAGGDHRAGDGVDDAGAVLAHEGQHEMMVLGGHPGSVGIHQCGCRSVRTEDGHCTRRLAYTGRPWLRRGPRGWPARPGRSRGRHGRRR